MRSHLDYSNKGVKSELRNPKYTGRLKNIGLFLCVKGRNRKFHLMIVLLCGAEGVLFMFLI